MVESTFPESSIQGLLFWLLRGDIDRAPLKGIEI